MAYGGGIFLPSETAYKDPNRFRDVLQAEGNKQATYLSQMDQFYAELEEMQRQFDVTTEQRERFFEEEMAFGREKLDWQSEENALDRSLQRWTVGQQTDVQREANETQRYLGEMNARTNQRALDLEERKFEADVSESEFLRNLYNRREERYNAWGEDLITKIGDGSASPSSSSYPGGSSGSYYNPFGSQSISEFLGESGGSSNPENFQDEFYNWY